MQSWSLTALRRIVAHWHAVSDKGLRGFSLALAHNAQQAQQPYLKLGAASSASVEELLSLGQVQPGVGRDLDQVLHALHSVTWAEGNLSRLSLGELEEMPEFACRARPTQQAGSHSQEGRATRIGAPSGYELRRGRWPT